MAFSVRRRRRGAAALLALTLPTIAACEDPEEFTEPEEVTFAAVAIDKATVRPREGERLTVGPTPYEFSADVHWQNMPSGSTLAVFIETHDSVAGQTFRWEGDFDAVFEELSGSSGSTTVSFDVALPEVSPFCGTYDYVRILAVVFPDGEAPPNSAYRDEVFYEVSGSDWSGPCVSNVFSVFPGANARAGTPMLVYGRDLPDELDVSLPGAQQEDNVWPGFIPVPEALSLLPVPNDGYMIAFVPVGAEDGLVRAFADGDEVHYGPDGQVTVDVVSQGEDVFEPNNTPAAAQDSIYLGLWDPFGFWGAYGYNPSLTLAGDDLTPDALAPEYGEGDWFYLYIPFEAPAGFPAQDLCVHAASHDGAIADLDLYVYDENGAIVDQSATASSSEAVRVDDVGPDDFYWVWVAPFLDGFTSTTGGYTYETGPCVGATTDVDRPNGPIAFRPEIGGSPEAPAPRLAPRPTSLPARADVRRGGVR